MYTGRPGTFNQITTKLNYFLVLSAQRSVAVEFFEGAPGIRDLGSWNPWNDKFQRSKKSKNHIFLKAIDKQVF